MKTATALLLGFAVAVAQILHGGAYIAALAWPAYALVLLSMLPGVFTAAKSNSPPAWMPLIAAIVVIGFLSWQALWRTDLQTARLDVVCLLAAGASFAVAAALPDGKSRVAFVAILLLALFGQAVIGGLQLRSEGAFSAPHWFSRALEEDYAARYLARMRGTFLNPNQLACFAGVVAIFSASLAIWGRVSGFARIFFGFGALVAVGVEIGTASRGGMVSLAVGFGVLLLLSLIGGVSLLRFTSGGGRILVGSVAALLVVGVVAAVAIGGSWTAQGRMATFEIIEDARGQLFGTGIRAFESAPIFGHGAGSFIYQARLYRDANMVGDPIYAHDDWLQLLAEYGWAGFGIFALGVWVLVGGGILRFARVLAALRAAGTGAASNKAAIMLGALAATSALVFHSFFDFNMRIPANALVAGCVLGFLTNPDLGRRRERGANAARAINVAVMLLFGGALGFSMWRFAREDVLELSADNARLEGEYEKAIELASAGLDLDSDNARLLTILARSQFAAAAGGLTRDYYGQVPETLVIDEEPVSGNRRSPMLDEAISSYDRLRVLNPRERAVFTESGAVAAFATQGDPTIFAVEGLRRDPAHGFGYKALGDALLDEGNLDAASRVFWVGAHQPGGEVCLIRFGRVEELRQALGSSGMEEAPR